MNSYVAGATAAASVESSILLTYKSAVVGFPPRESDFGADSSWVVRGASLLAELLD